MTRKIFSLSLAVLMLAGLGLLIIPAQANTPNYGDVDGNGHINAADVTLLRRRVSQGNESGLPSNYNRENADVNGDTFININDVNLLRRHVAAVDPSTVPLGPTPTKPVIRASDKLVAITYDDGPDATITPLVLEHWAKQPNAFTTFYINGIKINATTRPIVQRAVREGHAVENHGWDHRTFGALGAGGYGAPQITTTAEAITNINQCSQAIFDATGIWPWSFRPPFFEANPVHMSGIDRNSQIHKRPGETKLHVVRGAWLDTNDWQNNTAQTFADRVLNWATDGRERGWGANGMYAGTYPNPAAHITGADGGMILFHDIYRHTADAVPLFLPELYRRGYVCVTVEQLYAERRNLHLPITSAFTRIPGSPPNFSGFGETNGFDWVY